MSDSTVGNADKNLIIRESVTPMNCSQQWEAEMTAGNVVFIEVYCYKIRITVAAIGENVFLARENSKSGTFDYEFEMPDNKTELTQSTLIKLLDSMSLITEEKYEDDNPMD